ncbi:MAG TPA: 4-alpha-glucanotransferase [Spirochaetia bacterium]|nr:4-alpha-glucanotransferase [Spirochaetia bacterium]
MQFPELSRYFTGVLVPVASLRSQRSCGIGEFADLPLLGRFCKSVGLDLIQILPVNDTGFQSSPYSAISAFALHPVYIRFDDLPELEDTATESLRAAVEALRSRYEPAPRAQFWTVLAEKLSLLHAIFEACADRIEREGELSAWIEHNEWVREYAAFRYLKEKNEQRPWATWNSAVESAEEEVASLWNSADARPALLFHSWVQLRLEQQLLRASQELQQLGVMLKGDLPILMDEDSADVWAHRDFFNMDLRAGAPPDMFSELGQNWGFPVYDWEALAADQYSWWKARLRQADKFYNAYRIDHVLGFFRIWAIPAVETSGIMGYFSPAEYMSEKQLNGAKFDAARIRWLAEAHVSGARLRELFGDRAAIVTQTCFSRIDVQELFRFAEFVKGERDISALDLQAEEKEKLLSLYRDRSLIRTGAGTFAPSWRFRDCTRYGELSEAEIERFEDLVAQCGAVSEKLWEEHGRRLLSFMNSTVPMLTCAEDLGVIPAGVPRVLASLDILGLRIPRWARQWDEEDQPYIPIDEYPYLTVCAPSVHDTTTLREWWESEPTRQQFWESIGLTGECPEAYEPETAREVTRAVLGTGSAICVFPLQDLFALSRELRAEDPSSERVNVPGTYNNVNWTYRISLCVEELSAHTDWVESVGALVAERRKRKPKTRGPQVP